jgi:hypothetical protein
MQDSVAYSTDGIANYIRSKFSAQKERSWAIFTWIAGNIQYEFDSIFTNNYYETPSEASEKILRTRSGVCLQFASLFSEIANKAGIKSYVIQGYTKQQGWVDNLPHVWCAGLVDSSWYLFDPTWGSGYVADGKYVQDVNNFYFMANPEEFIRSHMPFDPLWQFLNYPVTNQEFYRNNFRLDPGKPFFNFKDTLETYEHESEINRSISSARRIEQNGVINPFLAAKLRVLKGKIAYYRDSTNAEKYSTAVNLYNEGIKKLNRFISHSNRQFKPEADSVALVQLLDSTEYLINSAVITLSEIRDPLENMTSAIILLNNSMMATMNLLNEQKAILRRYLNATE